MLVLVEVKIDGTANGETSEIELYFLLVKLASFKKYILVFSIIRVLYHV